MSRRMVWGLWGLAGLVALLLTAVSVELTVHAGAEDDVSRPTSLENANFEFEEEIVIQAGMPVYLTGEEIRVRTAPDPFADTINFLQPGSRVVIQMVKEAYDQPWYRIEAGRGRNGWIPRENVTINRPGSQQ